MNRYSSQVDYQFVLYRCNSMTKILLPKEAQCLQLMIMNTRSYLIISFICLFFGTLFFMYQQEIIIIRLRKNKSPIFENRNKKAVFLYYWQNEKWHKERLELIWPPNKIQSLEYLITNWLHLVANEQRMAKTCTLQTVIASPTFHEIYISFDRNPFLPEHNIQEKWMWVEGLLKTIKEADGTIQKVHLLVNHKILEDYHLDFTNAWPISGFLS